MSEVIPLMIILMRKNGKWEKANIFIRLLRSASSEVERVCNIGHNNISHNAHNHILCSVQYFRFDHCSSNHGTEQHSFMLATFYAVNILVLVFYSNKLLYSIFIWGFIAFIGRMCARMVGAKRAHNENLTSALCKTNNGHEYGKAQIGCTIKAIFMFGSGIWKWFDLNEEFLHEKLI